MTSNPIPLNTLHDYKRAIAAQRIVDEHLYELFKPYPWQEECYLAGADSKQRLIVAGNRVGKTLGLLFEVASHATGRYRDDWEGFRFKFAPTIWCCGVSGEQMRDVLQRTLLGDMDENGQLSGGLIHKRYIKSVIRDSGTPRLVKDVRVKHIFGESALISFKSYSQGTRPLMGASIDFALVDEQPPDDAYNQILTRTTLGNQGRGGLMLIGYTPELGVTEVLQEWLEDPKPGQWKRQVTWDDSPHLTEAIKEQMLEATSENERELRSKGMPVFGGGPVFYTSPEEYVIDPVVIPGHWRVVAAVDFGMRHKFACVWVATDPETGMCYAYQEYGSANKLPPIHAAAISERGQRVPIVYPHDGHIREKDSGRTLAQIYRSYGANLVQMFSNADGSLHVRPGLVQLNIKITIGQLKVFGTCTQLRREMLTYHYDKAGNPIAVNDDFVDAFRYAALSAGRLGVNYSDVYDSKPQIEYGAIQAVDY